MEKCDVAVLGAGPFGLSSAAHLRQVQGLDLRIFGEPMSFWEKHMPKGMVLRSPFEATNIDDPGRRLTVEAFERAEGRSAKAIPPPWVLKERNVVMIAVKASRERFIDYGHWFIQQAGLAIDRRNVVRIDPDVKGYRLILDNGEDLVARRVVIAGGIKFFAVRPSVFDGIPSALASHTCDHNSMADFRNKKILVIGGGQSALESAVLCHELGAQVEVFVRKPRVKWHGMKPWMHEGVLGWMLHGRADVGPPGVSQLTQRPNLFRRLPRFLQDWWEPRSVLPGASCWVEERARPVPIHTGKFVEQAREEGECLRVRLNDGSERLVHHVLLGTGYCVDIAKYPFLPPSLLERINCVNGFPRLDAGFESSSPGLHFAGATAAWSFGPLMRFVAGTEFSSPALLRRTLREEKRRLRPEVKKTPACEIAHKLPAFPLDE